MRFGGLACNIETETRPIAVGWEPLLSREARSAAMFADRANMQIAAGSSNAHQRVFDTKDGIERQPLAIIGDRLR